MDAKELFNTIVSLIILVFVLWAMRDVLRFFAAKYNLTGIVSFLS